MSQKRKRNEQLDGEHAPQAPVAKKPFKPGKGPHKFRPKRQNRDDDEPRGVSISELKSRIRSLRRLLDHVESAEKHKMPAGVRIERERELAACEHELAEKSAAAQEAERRRNLISKYHHVRFFDRQKATRILKKLRRQLPADGEEPETQEDKAKLEELRRDIHDAEVAVNYAIFYPLMKPYSSLYPRTKGNVEGNADTTAQDAEAQKNAKARGDPEMWAAVERAMEEGTLDALRNRDEGAASRRAKSDEMSKKKQEKKDIKGRQKAFQSRQMPRTNTVAANHDDGDESDGGFFE